MRVVIYPNDHRPAHVHIIGPGHEAVFFLHCFEGPVELRENYGFSSGELQKIEAALNPYVAHLCAAWKEIHGNP